MIDLLYLAPGASPETLLAIHEFVRVRAHLLSMSQEEIEAMVLSMSDEERAELVRALEERGIIDREDAQR